MFWAVILLSCPAFPQDPYAQRRTEAVQTFLQAFNLQDYGLMKKPLFGPGKLLIRKKALKKEFGPVFLEFGKARIDTLTFSHRYQYTAQLAFERDPNERKFVSFLFSEKGKVEGFGFAQPTLLYRKKAATRPGPTFSESLDARIRERHRASDNEAFSGCVLVMDGEKTLYKACFGVENNRGGPALSDQSRFDLASCGKQFTAVAIACLVDQGKLRFSDSLRSFFPELPYHGITLDHLLSHTSGLPEYQALLARHRDKSGFPTNQDVVALFAQHKPKVRFEPNQQFEYCNTGYLFLAAIVEKVSGQAFSAFLHQHIFGPAGMADTRVFNTKRSQKEIPPHLAEGYVYSGKEKRYVLPDSTAEFSHVVWMDALVGDGNVITSLRDMEKWEKACRDSLILQKSTWRKIYAPHRNRSGQSVGYGYGYFIRERKGFEPLVYHTGGWPGYLSAHIRLPRQDKTVVVMSNNSYDSFLRLADEVIARLLGE